MNKTPLATSIGSILAASSMATSNVALAQAESDDDVLIDDGTEGIEEVIVTGSRIKKDAFTTSSPMDIVDIREASVQGIANVGDLLQGNTTAAGSPQVTAATSFQFTTNGGLGTSTVSLRGLGANRTLVLLNGRRAGPSGVQGGVSSFDLNVLPLSTIERVEILKDGASSIYGSDAVAGVVNIITRKDDGGSIEGFTSQPSDNGGEESRLSLSYGRSLDRGNFRVTADYSKREHLRRGERDYFTCGNQYIFDQNTGERADITDPRTGERWCEDLTWGHVWIYDYAADSNIPSSRSLLSQPDYGDNLGQFIPGYAPPNSPSQLTAPGNFFPVAYDPLTDGITNDDHPFQNVESLNPKVELLTFYGEGEFEFTENLTGYAEVLFNRRETESTGYRQYWSYVYSGDFDFGSLGTGVPGGGNSLAAAAGWFGEQWFSPTAISDHNDSDVEIDYTRFVAGLRGNFPNTWEWDLSFNYSKSDGEYTDDRIFNDSIRDQNWLTGSCVGTTTSVRGVPCIDIPWFDPDLLRGDISPELRDFLYGTETGKTEYTQWSIDGFVTGEAWELPAGPLAFAAGFHYRQDELSDTPGAITLAENSWLDDFAGITKGDDETSAVFVEVDAPLIVDKPGFQNLTLNASARYTDVYSYGTDTTWKAGLNWQITDSLRFRGNRGTSFRSPALFELYIADQTGTISQRSDPCRDYGQAFTDGQISETVFMNCQADPRNLPLDYTGGTVTPTVLIGGGFGVLEAETADSTTLGFIWQPAFADLSVSIDYFDFEITDEVTQLGGENILAGCYDSLFGYAFGGTEPLCDLFDRTGINFGPDNVRDSYINIANQENSGFDFAVRYITEIGPGSLKVDFKTTKQEDDVQALFVETPEDLNGRVGDPEWVGESRVTYDFGAWSLFWGMDWVGDSDSTDQYIENQGKQTVTYRGTEYRGVFATDDVYYHAFSASYEWENGVTLLGGVANAFDENPPQLTRETVSTDIYTMIGNSVLFSNYDMLGRRFFVNATWVFE
ncbi:MAG: TonB-dependent receptor plug domain-containing protein [Woeseiaceae bacterium]